MDVVSKSRTYAWHCLPIPCLALSCPLPPIIIRRSMTPMPAHPTSFSYLVFLFPWQKSISSASGLVRTNSFPPSFLRPPDCTQFAAINRSPGVSRLAVLSLYRSYLTTAPFDSSNPPVHAALSTGTLDHFTDTMRLCTPRKYNNINMGDQWSSQYRSIVLHDQKDRVGRFKRRTMSVQRQTLQQRKGH